ncbi:hypothetical protein ACKC9G_03715 [Pokkaliibacter sp. CJK22405]|uniref:hypothetical protein n=1 Tax=Pokkaliibacter sp. CJK22405 TaxID=3384615 RepID=UPI003984FBC2
MASLLPRSLLSLLCCLFILAPRAHADSAAARLTQYLPSADFQADVMQILPPKVIRQLHDRIMASISQHQEWFQQYVAQAKQGQPLPYHPNFGITQEEYQSYLQGSRRFNLTRTAITQIKVTQDKAGNVMLSNLGLNPPYDHVIYHPATNTVSFAKVELDKFQLVNQQERNSITGRWHGAQWRFDTVSKDGKIQQYLKFAIGQLEDKDRSLIYIDGRTYDGELHNSSVVLMFDSPRAIPQ